MGNTCTAAVRATRGERFTVKSLLAAVAETCLKAGISVVDFRPTEIVITEAPRAGVEALYERRGRRAIVLTPAQFDELQESTKTCSPDELGVAFIKFVGIPVVKLLKVFPVLS